MAPLTPEYLIKLRNLHAAQQDIKDNAARFNVLCMGRRFGKTAMGLDLAIDPCLLDGMPVAWMAPKYKYVKEVYREACDFLAPVIAKRDGSEFRLDLVTGGVLEFWSLEDPDAARGRKYRRMIIDEAAMARHLEESWTKSLRATLMDYRGDAFFMSTPKGMVGPGKFFKELFDRGQPGNPKRRKSWKSWQLPTASNPYIHPSEIIEFERDLPPLVYQQEILAQFVDFGGTMVKAAWLHNGTPPPLPELRIYMAVDLAISLKEEADFTAIAVIGVDVDGRIWVLHIERDHWSFLDQMKAIERVAMKYRPLDIAIEAVQYQAVAVETLLRQTTLPVRAVRPDRDKLMRFQPVSVRYQHGLVWHADTLPPEWAEELLSFPLGEHDDMVDAVGYAIAMAGEFGRSQIFIPETTPQEIIAMDIEKTMPGLPAALVDQIADVHRLHEDVPETCGRCTSFEAGRCTLRKFIVRFEDPACDQYDEIPPPPEVITVDQAMRPRT